MVASQLEPKPMAMAISANNGQPGLAMSCGSGVPSVRASSNPPRPVATPSQLAQSVEPTSGCWRSQRALSRVNTVQHTMASTDSAMPRQ